MSNKEPVDVVLAFMDRINTADVKDLCRLMTEDHAFLDALGNRMQGRETMRKAWPTYFAWFPDCKVSHEEILQHGSLVAVFDTAPGTYAGEGKMPKENHWKVPAAWMAVVRNGFITEWRVYADNQPARKIMGWSNP